MNAHSSHTHLLVGQVLPCYVPAVSETAPEPRRRARWPIAAATFVVVTTLFILLRPLVPSGDGVGYIKRLVSPEQDIVPGHLVYIPILEGLRRLLDGDGGHAGAALIATAFSSIGGALACALLCWLVNRLTDRWWPGLVAAAGLAVSYGFYRASGDVEAYSTAVAVMVATACVILPAHRGTMDWWRVVAAGVLLAVCTLLHTSLVLFTLFVVVAIRHISGSWRPAILAMITGGVLSAGSFLVVGMGVLGYDLAETVSWILTADNGYAQPPDLSLSYVFRNLARLFYGFARTLVHSPAPDRLGVEASVHLSTLGFIFLIFLSAATINAFRAVPSTLRWQLRSLWAWVLPLLAFGFVFFPAATERWVFVLPCLWLALAIGLVYQRRPRLLTPAVIAITIGLPLLANISTVRSERELDRLTLERSQAISALLRPGDTLLYPGHTWDEYIGFYEDAPVERFILASFAGEEQGDHDALLQRLERRIEATFRRGGRVVAVRVFDPPNSHHGWSLLRALGIPRDDVLARLARYHAEPMLDQPVAVWEIGPAPEDGSEEPPGGSGERPLTATSPLGRPPASPVGDGGDDLDPPQDRSGQQTGALERR